METNKLPKGLLYALGKTPMRLTITNEETGEVLYTHATEGGVFCSVEQANILKETGEIDGNQQYLIWGHPAVWLHANLMLHREVQKTLEKNPELMKMAKEVFE